MLQVITFTFYSVLQIKNFWECPRFLAIFYIEVLRFMCLLSLATVILA